MEDIEPNKIEGTPFAGDFQDSTVSEEPRGEGKLNELQSLPGKIIRAEKFSDLKEIYPSNLNLIEMTQVAKKLYRELEEKYGITVPADFMIGKNEVGEKVVYSVVDKIDGENLHNVKSSPELGTQVSILYQTLVKYYIDKLETRGYFLWDIFGPQQYVYGKKEGEFKNKIYLIDTDLFISDSSVEVYLIMKWLTEAVIQEENHLGLRFSGARENIFRFITQPFPEDFDISDRVNAQKHVDSINRYLNKGNLEIPQLSSFE